jgi:hypothetical protein
MSTGGAKLTRFQERAIGALLVRPTVESAAAAAGVSYATLRRWLERDDFQRAYRAARRRALHQAVGRLQYAASLAVGALVRNLKCGRPSVECAAASALLLHATRGQEAVDLADEVAEIRDLVERQQKRGASLNGRARNP